MHMKISLALGERRPLSRQTAWGCLTTNIAMPGFGSLMAGRKSGYPQVLLGMGGMVLTVIFGVRALLWMLANWSRMHDPAVDQFEVMSQMWQVLRWAFLDMAIFGLGWLWALVSSYGIVRSTKNDSAAPPRLTS
jgi:hypothetical protein